MTDQDALRREIIATALNMNALGINQGKSGNVSARSNEGFLITPTGLPYERTKAEDIVFMRLDGSCEGVRLPSSEWRFHRDIYAQRPETNAIVHTHSVHATTLACLGRGIPAFHYMVAIAGGNEVRCARYATFGTAELAASAVEALHGRRACLLANHGVVALGSSLPAALRIAEEIEVLATQYLAALAVGEPVILDDAEMAAVHERFAGYGLPR